MILPQGLYELALSLDGHREIVASNLINIDRSGTVTGEYTDRSELRTVGWVTFGVGLAAGLGVMLMPAFLIAAGERDIDTPGWIVPGSLVMATSMIVGAILATHEDVAVVRFD